MRKGYIRCINCASIFDGYESVVSGEDGSDAAPDAPTSGGREPAAWQEAAAPGFTADGPSPRVVRQRSRGEGGPFVSIPSEPAAPMDEPDFHVGSPIHARPEPVFSAAPVSGERGFYMEPKAPDVNAGFDTPHYRRSSGLMQLVWQLLVLLAALLLAAQLVYVYRAQLANSVPMLRPTLERACDALSCAVPYSRDITAISITSSSLRAGLVDGTVPQAGEAAPGGDMLLTFTLRNTLRKPQEWPTIVLTLTDAAGAMVVRKNLASDAYLPPEMQDQPFGASSEITVRLPLLLNGRKVNGYQLEKFFQ